MDLLVGLGKKESFQLSISIKYFKFLDLVAAVINKFNSLKPTEKYLIGTSNEKTGQLIEEFFSDFYDMIDKVFNLRLNKYKSLFIKESN